MFTYPEAPACIIDIPPQLGGSRELAAQEVGVDESTWKRWEEGDLRVRGERMLEVVEEIEKALRLAVRMMY